MSVFRTGGAELSVGSPEIADGVACWRLAVASRVLDVNSRYAYVLWCRDFADTSVVARKGDEVVGFVTGYLRPSDPATLLVWQVAVAEQVRGSGVAAAMLDALIGRVRASHVETTITPDNAASVALFTAFARRAGASLQRSELFGSDLLGADHEPEVLFRIGPFAKG